MSTITIRIYEGEGIRMHSEMALVETTSIDGGDCDLNTGRSVALLLERSHPEFRGDSGILIYKISGGWESTRSVRRITAGSVHYFWQDAVISAA